MREGAKKLKKSRWSSPKNAEMTKGGSLPERLTCFLFQIDD